LAGLRPGPHHERAIEVEAAGLQSHSFGNGISRDAEVSLADTSVAGLRASAETMMHEAA
jgi:hypothetical protein